MMRENLFEALVGVLVVLLAIWFLFFAWQQTGGGLEHGIRVKALFPSANGVPVGSEVRIAGMKVGTVADQKLDPKSWEAELTLALDRDVKVPSDTSAAIASDGLLGGSYVSLQPGGSPAPLKNGDTILETQGSVDMMSLIGSFINNSGGKSGSSDNSSAAAGTAAPAAK